MPKLRKVKLNLPQVRGRGASELVEVNGIPIQHATRSLNLQARAGEITTLTVELFLREHEVDGDMVVVVDDQTREALLALGWTPPG